jgi:hypothetical protein
LSAIAVTLTQNFSRKCTPSGLELRIETHRSASICSITTATSGRTCSVPGIVHLHQNRHTA